MGDPLITRLREARNLLPNLRLALALIWRAAPSWTTAGVVLLVLQGLIPAISVNLTKLLVDSLVIVIDSDGNSDAIRLALLYAILMGVLLLLTRVLSSISAWVRAVQAELVQDHVTSLVHEQSARLDLGFYDAHEYYDHLYRARIEAGSRPMYLLDNMGSLLQNGITLVAMILVLIPYGFWLPLALVVSTLPALAVVLRHSQREFDWRQQSTSDRRRARYYSTLLTARDAAAELRLFDLGTHFQLQYQSIRSRLREEHLRLTKSRSLAQLGAGAFALVVTAGTMVLLIWQALQGLLTLGNLALLYQSFNYGQGLLHSLLENTGQIYSNGLFLGNLFEFLALEPQVIDAALENSTAVQLKERIRFQNISFQYPGSDWLALNNFTLDIPAGQIVAIVGANGAGKSTLLKLLCRFYDPQTGSIEIDGINLRDFPLKALRRSITVLFQQPVPYQDTVANNIALGDLSAEPSRQAIQEAARAASADIVVDKLPEGYDALLGKWFKDGTDLSLGEWQRIALARAFLRKASLIILDEPTSAMDPWAESDWLNRFRDLAQDRTSILITHRFTTARHADIIHVIDDGRIIESGSHSELLAKNGQYAWCWHEQMKQETSIPEQLPL